MIFDSHAHYNDEAFNEDRNQLLTKLHSEGVEKIVNVCADLASINETIELTEKYDFMYGALGIHPSDSGPLTEADMDRIQELCSLEKIVAVGEIGLDYHWPDPDHDTQKRWFNRQLELSREVKLPVIIHSREACKDTLDILKNYKDVNGIVHCYSYTKETARDYLDMGYSFGIGGVITFKNAAKLKEAVEYIPLDKIVLETDCPYLAPVPFRGDRNHSGNIRLVIEEIASIKNVSVEEVEEQCYNNTMKIYGVN